MSIDTDIFPVPLKLVGDKGDDLFLLKLFTDVPGCRDTVAGDWAIARAGDHPTGKYVAAMIDGDAVVVHRDEVGDGNIVGTVTAIFHPIP